MASALMNVSALGDLALTNPNNRRTVNLIARYARKFGVSEGQAAQKWKQEGAKSLRSELNAAKDGGFRKLLHGAGSREEVKRRIAALGLKKGDPSARAKSRRAAAQALAAIYGLPSDNGKRAHKIKITDKRGRTYTKYVGGKKNSKTAFVDRVLGGKGKVYRAKEKRREVDMMVPFFNKKTGKKGRKLKHVRVTVPDGIGMWNVNRQYRRSQDQYSHMYGHDPRPQGRGDNTLVTGLAKNHNLSRAEVAAIISRAEAGLGKARKAEWVAAARSRKPKAVPYVMKNNPSALGDLALTNPAPVGAMDYFKSYALPVTLAGAAAGAVHGLAAKQGVTAKISEFAEKIPVVGQYVAKAPFTIQGLAVGSLLALVSTKVGGKAGESIALAGGAALVLGGGIDLFNLIRGEAGATGDMGDEFDDLGDLALTNESALGELGFSEGSAIGDLALTNGSALGDGFAYQTAPLTAQDFGSADYGQASLQDAYYSGADFSVEEGQAILNGRDDFMQKFGAPARRMGAKSASHSHHAGRHGHRWGWLIKLLGWEKAQRIAALPPKQRLKVLQKIRAAALAASESEQSAAQATTQVEVAAPISGSSASAPAGASGPQAANGVGDLALTNFGDLAMTNMGDLALTNMGDLGYGDPALFSMA